MRNHVKIAHDTLVGLGFDLDHEDRKLRTDRWIFTHANEPDARLTLNYRMSEQAARTVVQRAKQVVGLATSETGKSPRRPRVNARDKAERAAEKQRREAARLAADARESERKARLLADRRQQQVGELDALMRGRRADKPQPFSGAGEWVTPEQIADEVGISDVVVKRAIASESLPAYQVGKRVLVKPADARAWSKSVAA